MCRNCDVIPFITHIHTHTHNVELEIEIVVSSTAQKKENLDQNPKEIKLMLFIKAYKNLKKVAVHEEKKKKSQHEL